MTKAWRNLLTPMPPHGNLTNMGLTEPETDRKKRRVRNGEEELEKERKDERLPGEEVNFWTRRHKHDPCVTPETEHLTL